MRTILTLKTGGTPSTSINEYWNGDIRWMSSGEVNKKRVHEVDGRITELGMQNSNAVYFPIHSVVIGLAGQGKLEVLLQSHMLKQQVIKSIAAVVFNDTVVNPFYYYHLLDFEYEKLRSVSAGAGRAGLSLNILSKYIVVMPNLFEQNKIAERLENY
jgi:type I restriction enzyme S subunit